MKGDRGFTLVELTIVVLLLGVMGLVTTSVVTNSFHRQAENAGRAVAIQSVRTALQRTMREIREADFPLLELTNTELDMNLTVNGQVTRVCYRTQTTSGVTSLVRTVSAPAPPPGSACQSSTAKTVVSHLANASVFTVLQIADGYNRDPAVLSTDCSEIGVSPTTYEQQCVGTVGVEFQVIPLNVYTGASLCPAGASPSACDIDVSDAAVLRNSP